MTVYTKVRARYTKGTLKLLQTLELPEGMEVRLDVTTPTGSKKPRRPGNGLTDSEALYD